MRPLIVVCGALLLVSLISIAAAAPVLYGGFSYNFTRTLLGTTDLSWNTSYLLRDGTLPMTGALNLSGNNISNVLNPVADQDAATKKYVDDVNNSASANASAYSEAINASVNTNLTAYITAVNNSVNTNLTAYIVAVNATVGAAGDTSDFLFLNGSRNMSGSLNMSGNNISNVLDPVAAQDAATKKYVDDVNASASANASAYSVAINESVNANLTAYITAVNATTSHGSGDMTWNLSYLLLSGTRAMTGKFDAGGFNLSNLLDPVVAQDAATKNYVDVAVAGGSGGDTTHFLFLNGTRPMAGNLSMGGYNISSVLDPVAAQDAATKNYVDTKQVCGATYVS